MRIGVVHATLNAVEPLVKALKEQDSSVEVCNFVNEELLFHANQSNGVDDWGLRNFYRLFMQAAESSVDGIIVACSLYSTYVEEASKLTDKPVIAIDQPMVEAAACSGKKIGILATTASAGPAEEKKIQKEALRRGMTADTLVAVRPEAFKALKGGDERVHDQMLYDAAKQLMDQGCELIVLSQITMACAGAKIRKGGMEVLTSPETGAKYMINEIKKRERK